MKGNTLLRGATLPGSLERVVIWLLSGVAGLRRGLASVVCMGRFYVGISKRRERVLETSLVRRTT